MTDVDTSTLNFDEDELKSAGLQPMGWYLFRLTRKKFEHVEGGISSRTGKPYDAFDVVKVTALANSRANYDDNGNFVDEVPFGGGLFQDINLDSSQPGLARLKGLYKAIRGQNLTGAGNVESIAEELVGGEFWARIYHREDNNGVMREQMDTYRFRSRDYGPPATISVRTDG